MRYGLKISARLNEQAVNHLREEAGRFVLISNTPAQGAGSISARELLTMRPAVSRARIPVAAQADQRLESQQPGSALNGSLFTA
jgi:hypothetical protein